MQVGHYVSEEGVLLFVRRLRLSVDDWVKLTALAVELGQLRSSLSSVSGQEPSSGDHVTLPSGLAAGCLHRRRRSLLKSICCASEEHRLEMLETCRKKLAQYR